MGLFMRPRRPLMRVVAGAAVAGTASHVGTERAQQEQVNARAQAAYEATRSPAAAPPVVAPTEPTAEIDGLAQLRADGTLIDAELAAGKAKGLGI